MLRLLRWVFRLPFRFGKTIRRRPRLSLLVVLLLIGGAIGGAWGYGTHQWRAAHAALKADRPAEARDRLAFCLRIWPRNAQVHHLAARAARLTGDIQNTETHLNRCLELEGGATEAVQLEFLLLRVQTGEVDTLAPMLFDAVEKGHTEAPIILETLARAYILHLRYKPAYACLSRWIELEPHNAKPFHWRGWALERLNNPKAARVDYHRALELDPELIPVRLRVAEMFLDDRQGPEALPHLERLSRQVPNDPQVQARMGICLFLHGRVAEAQRLMEAALVHLPNDASLLVALANLDLQAGRGEQAERRLRTVLAADPSDTETLFVLSSVLRFLGRNEEAATAMAEHEQKRLVVERINLLLKDVADSPTAKASDYVEIGEMFLQIRRDRFGVYYLEQALERDPTNQAAHRALATHYERKGDANKALVHRRQLRPTDSEGYKP